MTIETITLAPDYTQVMFSGDHLGFSHPTAQIAQGTGTLEFDPMQPTMASLQVTLPVGLLTTGVPELYEVIDDAVIDKGLGRIRRFWDIGVAHRDINPANLLVQQGRMQLVDVHGLEAATVDAAAAEVEAELERIQAAALAAPFPDPDDLPGEFATPLEVR